MMDFLAQAVQPSNLPGVIGGGITMAAIFGLWIKHITNRGAHLNGTTYVSEDVYRSDQQNIKESLHRIESQISSITVIHVKDQT